MDLHDRAAQGGVGWVEISSTFRFYNNGHLPRMLLTSMNGLIRWWEAGLLLSAEYDWQVNGDSCISDSGLEAGICIFGETSTQSVWCLFRVPVPIRTGDDVGVNGITRMTRFGKA